MTDGTRSQQLDQQVEQLLKRRSGAAAHPLQPLLRVASALGDLPHPDFKKKLRADLQRRARMATNTLTRPEVEANWLAPYLTVDAAEQVVEFIKQSFGAEELQRGVGSAGGLHCTLKLGDSTIMVGGGGQYKGPYYPTALHIYVPDCDGAYQKAVAGGATSLGAPEDRFYGERSATVRDMGGNVWYIATALQGNYRPAGLNDAMLALQPTSADGLLDFIKRAFGAEEVAVHRMDEESLKHMPGGKVGSIAHATLRLGASILEMGEAHGPWQNMPTTIYLQVRDCDATYESALAAGGKSVQPPANLPYGRMAAVTDEWQNTWYISAPPAEKKA